MLAQFLAHFLCFNQGRWIASSIGIVDWNRCSGGMSRDIVFFDEHSVDSATGAPTVH